MNKKATINTTTLIVDFENSDFQKFESKYKLVKYLLPKLLKDDFSSYGNMHMHIKEQCGNIPYYYHSPQKIIYIIQSINEENKKINFKGEEVEGEIIKDYDTIDVAHCYLKVLMASYFYSIKTYNNNKFLIVNKAFNSKRGHSYQTVLELNLYHNHKVKDRYELFIHDTATRMKKIKKKDYFESKSKKEMPYIAVPAKDKDGNDYIKAFRQINSSEFDKDDKIEFIYVKNTDNKNRTSIHYHSVNKYKKTRSYHLEEVLQGFQKYAKDLGIITERKSLHLEEVQDSTMKDKYLLNFSGAKIGVVNGLLGNKHSVSDFIDRFKNSKKYKNKTAEKVEYYQVEQKDISENNSMGYLYVMDYGIKDFEDNEYAPLNGTEYTDGYKEFKNKLDRKNIAYKGLCINEKNFSRREEERQDGKQRIVKRKKIKPEKYLDYKGLPEKGLSRNLEVCLNQLYLQNLLIKSEEKKEIPHLDLIKKTVFVQFWKKKDGNKGYCKMFYVENGQAKVEDWNEKKMQQITGRKDTHISIYSKRKEYNEHLKADNPFKLIISPTSILEIEELKERVIYDDKQLKEKFNSRDLVEYPKEQYCSWEKEAGDFTAEQLKEYNKYVKENIFETEFPYNLIREGKEHWNKIATILNLKDKNGKPNETKYVNFLNSKLCGMEIQGKTGGEIFTTAQGIWFDRNTMQYFVGNRKGNPYNATSGQAKGFQVRKVIELDGTFDKNTFFKLLDVKFVRYGQYTVVPYPFNLIKKDDENEE